MCRLGRFLMWDHCSQTPPPRPHWWPHDRYVYMLKKCVTCKFWLLSSTDQGSAQTLILSRNRSILVHLGYYNKKSIIWSLRFVYIMFFIKWKLGLLEIGTKCNNCVHSNFNFFFKHLASSQNKSNFSFDVHRQNERFYLIVLAWEVVRPLFHRLASNFRSNKPEPICINKFKHRLWSK